MPFKIIRNDITKVKADAIVNTANPKPVCGGGTNRAIYTAAGMDDLLKARQKIGDMERGSVAVTDALAAITGSIAEAFYDIPVILRAECRERIDEDMKRVWPYCFTDTNSDKLKNYSYCASNS